MSFTYHSYIEAPYLAPVFTSKPIIITLHCPDANPRAAYCLFSVVFPRKVTKAKAQARALAYS